MFSSRGCVHYCQCKKSENFSAVDQLIIVLVINLTNLAIYFHCVAGEVRVGSYFPVYTVYNTTTGTKIDTIIITGQDVWQCTCRTVYTA